MKTRFEGELAGLPPEVAAELEDHLLSRMEGHLAAGCDEVEAHRRTLADFGDLHGVGKTELGEQCLLDLGLVTLLQARSGGGCHQTSSPVFLATRTLVPSALVL